MEVFNVTNHTPTSSVQQANEQIDEPANRAAFIYRLMEICEKLEPTLQSLESSLYAFKQKCQLEFDHLHEKQARMSRWQCVLKVGSSICEGGGKILGDTVFTNTRHKTINGIVSIALSQTGHIADMNLEINKTFKTKDLRILENRITHEIYTSDKKLSDVREKMGQNLSTIQTKHAQGFSQR